MTKKSIILLVLTLNFQTITTKNAYAEPSLELMSFFEEALSIDQAMNQDHVSLNQTKDNEAWYFRNFWLRIRAKFGFEVPGFAKLQVVPEAELLWQRDFPEGWGSYRPKK